MKQIRDKSQKTSQNIIISIDFVFTQGKDDFDINNLSQHSRKQTISLFEILCLYKGDPQREISKFKEQYC